MFITLLQNTTLFTLILQNCIENVTDQHNIFNSRVKEVTEHCSRIAASFDLGVRRIDTSGSVVLVVPWYPKKFAFASTVLVLMVVSTATLD
jgi:hypothetical protein